MIVRVAQVTTHGCGQACLAMLLGLSFEEACALVGHTGGTTTAELAHVLRRRYECPDRLVLGRPRTDPALVKLRIPGSRDWHWVVYAGARILDPGDESLAASLGARPSSHLPLSGGGARPIRRGIIDPDGTHLRRTRDADPGCGTRGPLVSWPRSPNSIGVLKGGES